MANWEKPNKMEALADFLKEMSIEEDIVDVTPPSGSGEGYPQSVYKIENDFGVTLSELGRKEVAHLICHFEINNNAVYVTKAVAKWASDIPKLCTGETRWDAVSKFLEIIQHIVTPRAEQMLPSFSIVVDSYDQAVIKYVAGWILNKVLKKSKENIWDNVVNYLSDYNADLRLRIK